ncbi:MAG: ATP-binding protein [Gaiellaceae bacterium]
MQLLERDDALTALAEAHASAARGAGRVVLVSGEPGIGKTMLVASFLADLGGETKALLGTCDDLSIARPLGPFSDLVGSVSGALEEAILNGARPQELHPLLVAELEPRSRPTVLVLEDVHWADDATLDAITFLARRIGSLHAVLILTLRTGEAPLEHPLHAALGDVAASNAVFVELSPLSEQAVAALAGADAGRVFAATRGNPFYVTELVSTLGTPEVPPSVAHAVVGRASRLDADARRLVELVAVVPRRIPTSLLDRAFPDWPYAAAEAERRHLLEVRPRWVSFRHELARTAIHESIPAATRRRLHIEILEALLATNGDSADIVHHAEAAGAEDVVAEHALIAARRAAALHSNREAYAHYHRAVDFLDRLSRHDQACVLEELVDAAFLAGRLADAIAANTEAIGIWQELGDRPSIGRCTRVLSRLHWFVGDGALARAEAVEATAMLEPFGDSSELACAYSGAAQLAMLAADGEGARSWGGRAIELAERLDDETARVHALVTLATVDVQLDPTDVGPLLEAHRLAHASGSPQEAVRALANLGFSLLAWGLPSRARPYTDRAIAEADEHEIHHIGSYAKTTRALSLLRAGDWAEAERIAKAEVRKGASVSELLARTVLAELAVRRGDPDAAERVADVYARAERTGDVPRIVPVLDLLTEQALIAGTEAPGDRLRALLDWASVQGRMSLCLDAIAVLAGLEVDADGPPSSPYTFVARREWLRAAAAFGEEGWNYHRALMLSLADDEQALVESLEIARGLGAEPLVRRAARRLRELGLRVPRGPYAAARANPGGLTARQLEVLALVAAGRTNADIADELVVSLRTAEHHVGAVLAKLGAASRRDAALRAGELGILSVAG